MEQTGARMVIRAVNEKQIADIQFKRKVHETEKAWLFQIEDDRVWIPKSISEVDFGDKTVSVPMQWAIDHELV